MSSTNRRQTELTSCSFGTLLRVLIKLDSKAWDLLLPHAKFAYNKAPSKAVGLSSFETVYGSYPLSPFDVMPQPMDQKPSMDAAKPVEEIQKLHEQVKGRIEKVNMSYRA